MARDASGGSFFCTNRCGMPPAAYFFLDCQKKVCKKETPENEIAPSRLKSLSFCLAFCRFVSVVKTPFGRAAESGFPSARHTVQVVSFAPIEYLTYGIRTMSILLRAVGADVGIGPYKGRNTFHGNRQKRLSTPARDFSSEAGARMKAYRVYVESEQRTSGGKDPPEA